MICGSDVGRGRRTPAAAGSGSRARLPAAVGV